MEAFGCVWVKLPICLLTWTPMNKDSSMGKINQIDKF